MTCGYTKYVTVQKSATIPTHNRMYCTSTNIKFCLAGGLVPADSTDKTPGEKGRDEKEQKSGEGLRWENLGLIGTHTHY